jgi:hypothetical protein
MSGDALIISQDTLSISQDAPIKMTFMEEREHDFAKKNQDIKPATPTANADTAEEVLEER